MNTNTFQLPSGKNVDIITKQIDQMLPYQVLKSFFEEQGFEFIYSRAQVFMTYDNNRDDARPSLMLVIPSLVPVDLKADANHKAVGITVLINDNDYAFVATEVLVNHAPYSIENYTLYSLTDDQTVAPLLNIDKKALEANEVETITSMIESIEIDPKRTLKGGVPKEDFQYIINSSLSKFLSDEYTQQYPDAYRNSMLKECSLVEKFSQAIALKKQNAESSAACCCSCTCCNGCTTTSSSFTISW
jgi:hypothetical protein